MREARIYAIILRMNYSSSQTVVVWFKVLPAGSVGASAPQRCSPDTRTPPPQPKKSVSAETGFFSSLKEIDTFFVVLGGKLLDNPTGLWYNVYAVFCLFIAKVKMGFGKQSSGLWDRDVLQTICAVKTDLSENRPISEKGGLGVKGKFRVKLGDILLLVAIALLAGVLFLLPFLSEKAKTAEIVIAETGEVRVISLNQPAEYEISSRGVSLTVTVKDGAVFVSRSDCRDGICRNTPSISRAGQAIVCVPAGVVIRISGEGGIVDGIAG